MSKARDLADFGDDISDGVISAALDGDGSALTGLSIPPSVTEVVSSGTLDGAVSLDFTNLDFDTYSYSLHISCYFHDNYKYLYWKCSNDNLSTFLNFYSNGTQISSGSTSVGAGDSGAGPYDHVKIAASNTSYVSTSQTANIIIDMLGNTLPSSKQFMVFSRGNAFQRAMTMSGYTYLGSASAQANSIRLQASDGVTPFEFGNYTLYRTVKS